MYRLLFSLTCVVCFLGLVAGCGSGNRGVAEKPAQFVAPPKSDPTKSVMSSGGTANAPQLPKDPLQKN